MSSAISKDELEHLAKLARVELDPMEEEKMLKDLSAILDYFKELQKLDTANVPPMTGGTDLQNIFREDSGRENTNQGAGIEAFPEKKDGFLKIPPVFE
jgi:aspartyl-tRNA(Asn)/glutamyl-tRNA(Gln) amidotransferase subunit C